MSIRPQVDARKIGLSADLQDIIRVQISCLTTFPTLKTLGIARL
jgi:hypothetical protein